MKKISISLLTAIIVMVTAVGFTSCKKTPSIIVSTQNVWFDTEAGTQKIEIQANCDWSAYKNEHADWYEITPAEGNKDGTITIMVKAMNDADYRGSSFMVVAPGGGLRRTVFVSQNKIDFEGLYNKIYSVMSLEHWNTDYYDQIVEDSYQHDVFNPYDTAQGYQMYFFDNGKGAQKDNVNGVWFSFDYEFNPVTNNLFISFETVDGSPDDYHPEVLTASDSLFRFIHEYKPHWWERADMRKIGTIDPLDRAAIQQKTIKRKERGPIFQF